MVMPVKDNILIDKSIAFAARIIKLNQYLVQSKKESVISKQIVRSGTSIGANIKKPTTGIAVQTLFQNSTLL